MKFNLKLSSADKIGIVVGGAVVWVVGILPIAIVGGTGWAFQDKIKAFFIKKQVQAKVKTVLSYFANFKK